MGDPTVEPGEATRRQAMLVFPEMQADLSEQHVNELFAGVADRVGAITCAGVERDLVGLQSVIAT